MTTIFIDSVCPNQTRVAALEDGVMTSFDQEDIPRKQLRGNIYICKVTYIESSLQAAFVDYGQQKQGFLPISEISPLHFQNISEEEKESLILKNEKTQNHKIQDIIYKNQEFLVQINKEEKGNKCASVTTNISLVGCYCVLTPLSKIVSASKTISDPLEKEKVIKTMQDIQFDKKHNDKYGVILKSASCNVDKQKIESDYTSLIKIWEEKISSALNKDNTPAPQLIHLEENIINRTIRSSCNGKIDAIIIDGYSAYIKAKAWAKKKPHITTPIKLYRRKTPCFLHHKIEEQILALYDKKVVLPSGGYLIIDITEALIAIDVNSGKMTKGNDVEYTAYKTNLEAATLIAKQLELRNLAGLIIVDFIDMERYRHCRAIEEAMEKACKECNAQIQTSNITEFGLMQISRQRTKPNILELNTTTCAHCSGTGFSFSEDFIFNNIIKSIYRDSTHNKITVYTSQKAAIYILNHKRTEIFETQKSLSKEINIYVDENLGEEIFRLECENTNTTSKKINKSPSVQNTKKMEKKSWVEEWIQFASEKSILIHQKA